MKRFMFLIFLVTALCLVYTSEGRAERRYNPNDWQYIKDVSIDVIWDNPNFSYNAKFYGGNCKYFVSYVCVSEDRGSLPAYTNGYRELADETHIEGGQWLNENHNNTGPSSADVKNLFANATTGDVIQMYWGGEYRDGTPYDTQHTALVNYIDDGGVEFFHSNWGGRTITSTYFDWDQLSSMYRHPGASGGLSIYSHNNTDSEPPKITTTTESLAQTAYIKGTQYTITLEASGTTPITWSHVSGSLPDNMTLNDDGTITGTPSKAGTFTFTVKAQNSAGASKADTKELSLTVIEQAAAPRITIDDGYTVQWLKTEKLNFMLVAEGTAPITWSISGGNLPPGVEFSSGGSFSGYASSAGKYTFTVKAENSVNYDMKTMTLDIYDTGEKPSITTKSLSAATVGKSYSKTLAAKGRTPLTWTATNLPEGLSLSTAGKLSGKPKESGTFKIKFKAKNELGTASKTISLTVRQKPSITTSAIPSYGTVGGSYHTVFTASGNPAPEWSVTLLSAIPTGLTFDAGVLSGTFTKAGTYNFTVKAANSAGSSEKAFKIVVDESEQEIITTELPAGTVGKSYSAQLKADNITGGSWCTTDTMPVGLKLTADGKITGTPQRAGTYGITFMAVNMNGSYVTKYLTLVINGELAITTSKLSKATVGKPYKATLKATGSKSYTWFMTDTMPVGLTLSSKGVISGTPVYSGTYYINVYVRDKYGAYTDKQLQLVVAEKLSISTKSLKAGTVGTSYKVQLKASSTLSCDWCTTSTMPPGLTLSSKGLISGTPQQSGQYYMTFKAVNANGNYTEKELSIDITGGPVITTESLSDATVGKSYKATLKATGSKSYTWFTTDTMPPGLTLSSKGVISGTPACKGTYYMTVYVRDKYGAYTNKQLELVIGGSDENDAISLSSALVGKSYNSGSFYVSFSHSIGKISWSLSSLPKGLSFASDGHYCTISGKPTKAGHYRMKATLKDELGQSVYRYLSLTVYENPSITTKKTLPEATVGKSYSVQLEAAGADSFVWYSYYPYYYWGQPYYYAELPSGLTLSPSGLISGTPLYAGDYHDIYIIAVTPSGKYVSRRFHLTINEGLAITTKRILPEVVAGKSYSVQLEAVGADSFVWYLHSYSSLPYGLTLSPSGLISGTPLYEGDYYEFNVSAVTPSGRYVDKRFYITVEGEGLSITTKKILPEATAGKSYKVQLKATGADSFVWYSDPNYWYYGYHNLPSGLTLSPSGLISGTPLYAGDDPNIYIRAVTPSGQCVDKIFYLSVNEGLSITTKSGLPEAEVGKSYSVQLKASGADSFVWYCNGGYNLPSGLTLSPSGVISGIPLYAYDYDYFYIRAVTPSGQYIEKIFYITVNSSVDDTASSVSAKALNVSAEKSSPQSGHGSSESFSTESESKSESKSESESYLTFGHERKASSLSAETLRTVSNDTYMIAAILPEITASKEGMYDFAVSLDKNVPTGAYLVWYPFPNDGKDDDNIAVFTDSDGKEVTLIPDDYNLNVSAWLRENVTYSPVIAARTGHNTVSTANSDSGDSNESSSGGCSTLHGAFMLVILAGLMTKKR